ncbi:MAG: hypothetical protein OSJ61_16405 [Lachnospiraceae bacterium]|nr:hypothetical protein [Lachnospiraceae bacterium]
MAGKAPQGQLTEMNPVKVKAIIHSLRELYDMGKPETNLELKERIDMFFQFCEDSSVRPGVQALCTALHISRTTLFRWSNGEDCDRERQEIVSMAKSFIDSFLEQVTLSGQVSPPVGIFLLKNWCSYKDTVSIEESTPHKETGRVLSANELPKLFLKDWEDKGESLPELLERAEKEEESGRTLPCLED